MASLPVSAIKSVGSTSNPWWRYLLFLYLLLLSTNLYYCWGAGGRNNLLIGAMFLVPLWLFLISIDIKIILPVFGLPLYMSITAACHWTTFNYSTLMFSWMFVLTFAFIIACANKIHLRANQFLLFLKFLVYSFAAVLLIQHVSYFLGLPVFNRPEYYVSDYFCFNSLGTEPSYTARCIFVMIYCYFSLSKTKSLWEFFKKEKWLILSVLYICFGSGSTTGLFLFLILILLNLSFANTIIVLLFLAIAISLSLHYEITAALRVRNIIDSVLSPGSFVEEMQEADFSGAQRFIPMVTAWENFDWSDIGNYLGHGNRYAAAFFSRYLPYSITEGDDPGGIMSSYWMDYGLISLALLFGMAWTFCFSKNQRWKDLVVWLCIIVASGINIQNTWVVMSFLALKKYVISQEPQPPDVRESVAIHE